MQVCCVSNITDLRFGRLGSVGIKLQLEHTNEVSMRFSAPLTMWARETHKLNYRGLIVGSRAHIVRGVLNQVETKVGTF